MIAVSPSTPVYVYPNPVDFRNGIDGLCGFCKYQIKKDPMSGAFFVFTNRERKSLKILAYDGQGYWLCQKRLSLGRFKWPKSELEVVPLLSRELMVLVWNGDYEKLSMSKDWKSLDI